MGEFIARLFGLQYGENFGSMPGKCVTNDFQTLSSIEHPI
jgi:hypothetical protein